MITTHNNQHNQPMITYLVVMRFYFFFVLSQKVVFKNGPKTHIYTAIGELEGREN